MWLGPIEKRVLVPIQRRAIGYYLGRKGSGNRIREPRRGIEELVLSGNWMWEQIPRLRRMTLVVSLVEGTGGRWCRRGWERVSDGLRVWKTRAAD